MINIILYNLKNLMDNSIEMMKSEEGLTLIELLEIIAILGYAVIPALIIYRLFFFAG